MKKALPPRMKKRDATRSRKLRSRRMSVPQASAGDRSPAPAAAGPWPPGPRRAGRAGTASSRSGSTPSGDRRQEEVADREPERRECRADHGPEDREHPDHRAGQTDLRGGHEIGDVALERALGEVRAELEEGHERGEGEDGVRRREPDEEDEVERRADHDVRLAPPEAADRVVADRADGRLDEDRDDDARPPGRCRASCTGCSDPGRSS